MIMEGLRVLLLGMLGIFLMMGIIVLALVLMKNIVKKWGKDKAQE